MTTKLYGYSDDTIEAEGDIDVSLSVFGSWEGKLRCSDGTVLDYTYDGNFRFTPVEKGSLFDRIDKGNDEEDTPDIVWFKDGLQRIERMKKTYRLTETALREIAAAIEKLMNDEYGEALPDPEPDNLLGVERLMPEMSIDYENWIESEGKDKPTIMLITPTQARVIVECLDIYASFGYCPEQVRNLRDRFLEILFKQKYGEEK